MESSDLLTEGIGNGRLNRIVMGKLGIEIDLLERIEEMVKKRKRFKPVYLELEQPMEILSLTGWMERKRMVR
jgi:hypothetical protein